MKNYVNNFQNNLIGSMNSMSNIFQDKMSNDINSYIEKSMSRVLSRYNKKINLSINIPNNNYYTIRSCDLSIFQYGLKFSFDVIQTQQDPSHTFFRYTNEYFKSFERQIFSAYNGTGDLLLGSINYDYDGLLRFNTLNNVFLNNNWLVVLYGSFAYSSFNLSQHDVAF